MKVYQHTQPTLATVINTDYLKKTQPHRVLIQYRAIHLSRSLGGEGQDHL